MLNLIKVHICTYDLESILRLVLDWGGGKVRASVERDPYVNISFLVAAWQAERRPRPPVGLRCPSECEEEASVQKPLIVSGMFI